MPAAQHAAFAVPDAREVRLRIPRGPRLSPTRRRVRLRRRDGRGHRRDAVQVCRAPRDAGLHRGKLHAVHGVHHRLPRHRAAQHRAGCRAPCSRPRRTITSRTPPSGRKFVAELERHRGTRPREDERVREGEDASCRSRTSSATKSPRSTTISDKAKAEFTGIIDKLPLAYSNVPAIFRSLEAKTPGAGGLFSIFVSDLCKGCGECVQVCGDHDALRMTRETEDLNAELTTAQIFSRLLPDTPQKFLGLYNDGDAARFPRGRAAQSPHGPAQLRGARLRRRRVRRLRREEHSARGGFRDRGLHAPALSQEGRPPPRQGRRASRTEGLRKTRSAQGAQRSGIPTVPQARSRTSSWASAARTTRTPRNASPITRRSTAPITDEQIIGGLVAVMRQDAFNHKELQAIDGRRANGMSVMMMGASTGCNTVYGSTPPSNPHPYPWMNSLFQDGATISWLHGRVGHRQSRAPLRRARAPRRRAARPRRKTS